MLEKATGSREETRLRYIAPESRITVQSVDGEMVRGVVQGKAEICDSKSERGGIWSLTSFIVSSTAHTPEQLCSGIDRWLAGCCSGAGLVWGLQNQGELA